MKPKTNVFALLVAYREAKLAVRMALPSLSSDDLDKLAEEAGKMPEPPAPKAKPGPKPKAAEPAPQAPQTKPAKKPGKPGPKVKGKPGKKPGQTPFTTGAKDRPSLLQALKTVMGSEELSVTEIYQRMGAKGWLPASANPRNYIGSYLPSRTNDFERLPHLGQGYYRVRQNHGVHNVN